VPKGVSRRKRVLSIGILVALLVTPIAFSAGVFSFTLRAFANMIAPTHESNTVPNEDYNAQTVPLLRAVVNTNPNAATDTADVALVHGAALLSEAGPSGTIADIIDAPQSDQISLYVVREGDSLSGIAHMFGVTINTIMWANDLKRGSAIQPGQELIILPITGIQHTVLKGETLASIAKKYSGDADEILQYNGLESASALSIGTVVMIPGGEVPAPVSSSSSAPTAPLRGAGGPSYQGYYTNPVPGAKKTQGLHGYNGVDLGAPVGTPVHAAASGRAIIVKAGGWNGGYGSYIVIAHDNGTQTLYAHLSAVSIPQGAAVAQGQVIGKVGRTGKATGPHLHIEVRGAKNPF